MASAGDETIAPFPPSGNELPRPQFTSTPRQNLTMSLHQGRRNPGPSRASESSEDVTSNVGPRSETAVGSLRGSSSGSGHNESVGRNASTRSALESIQIEHGTPISFSEDLAAVRKRRITLERSSASPGKKSRIQAKGDSSQSEVPDDMALEEPFPPPEPDYMDSAEANGSRSPVSGSSPRNPPGDIYTQVGKRILGLLVSGARMVNIETVQEEGMPDTMRRYTSEVSDEFGVLGRLDIQASFTEARDGANAVFWESTHPLTVVDVALPKYVTKGLLPEEPISNLRASAIKLFKPKANPEQTEFQCRKCSSSFESEEDLKRHKRQVPYERYTCNICRKVYNTRRAIGIHMSMHNRERRLTEEFEKREKGRLNRLLEKKNMPTGLSPGELTRAAFVKARKRKMDQAEKADAGPVVCGVCPAVFQSRNECMEHRDAVHSKEELAYPCHYCTATFTTEEGKREHEFAHTPNVYPCPVCPKRFSKAADGLVHMLKRHQISVDMLTLDPANILVPRRALEEERSRSLRAPVGLARDDAAAAASAALPSPSPDSAASTQEEPSEAVGAGDAGSPDEAQGPSSDSPRSFEGAEISAGSPGSVEGAEISGGSPGFVEEAEMSAGSFASFEGAEVSAGSPGSSEGSEMSAGSPGTHEGVGMSEHSFEE